MSEKIYAGTYIVAEDIPRITAELSKLSIEELDERLQKSNYEDPLLSKVFSDEYHRRKILPPQ